MVGDEAPKLLIWPRPDTTAGALPAVSCLVADNGCVATYRDEGVVLRTHKLGEADRIITLLCRGRGKVRAVARGVRRTSSKFGGRLEPFSHVDAQFAEGRSLDVVTQVVSLNAYGQPLVDDYEAFTAGEAMLETADRMVAMEGEPAVQQYRLLLGALRVLGSQTTDGPRPPSMILDSYLLRSLAVGGYAPSLDQCARCQRPMGPADNVPLLFSPAAGGLVCPGCRPPGAAHLNPDTVGFLGALLAGDWPATRGVDVATQRQASGLIAAFASWHMEHSLRSLPLVERNFVQIPVVYPGDDSAGELSF